MTDTNITAPSAEGQAKPTPAPVVAWSYTLRTEGGGWLAQVVLTSDGMFSAVSDWGNFSYAWRAFGQKEGRDFRDFILALGVDYFGQKMVNGMAYVANSRKIEAACHKFTEKVLPVLKEALKAEGRSA